MLAIRQLTQLNQGKKTAGIDGKKKLTFRKRIELEKEIAKNWKQWKHQKLREIPISKTDGTTRMLKVPTIADRAWQCLIKYAIEPAHEALFHARSYGFRPKPTTRRKPTKRRAEPEPTQNETRDMRNTPQKTSLKNAR